MSRLMPPEAPSSVTQWLARLARLRVDSDSVKGRAPHKPLLLLAVLELLEEGPLLEGLVPLSADLVLRFHNFWPIVEGRRQNRGDIRMPFHALSNDRIWQVFDPEGRPSRSRETSKLARLDGGLLALLGDPGFRRQVRTLLLQTYFPLEEQAGLEEALGVGRVEPCPAVREQPAEFVVSRRLGRSAHFRTEVILGYRFTCALTGYSLMDAAQLSLVEAAHIHAFSESLNNDPANGLALTPTAHALFDRGLWSVDDALRIVVKPEACFREQTPPGGFSLRALAGRTLHFDPASRLRPAAKHLAWHRKEHGFV